MRTFPTEPSTRTSVTAEDMQKAAAAFTQSLLNWIKAASAADIHTLRVLIASHRVSQLAVASATKAAVSAPGVRREQILRSPGRHPAQWANTDRVAVANTDS